MEIKNCSIYPRYEESLPKMSRIPEFALFMYHRHGKSNRVKCLPHSNGQALRARFKSVRALRFLLHTLRLRYFCSGKIHKFCCKIASMQVELTLFVTPSLKVSWLPSEVYVLSGDLSKRALRPDGVIARTYRPFREQDARRCVSP